MDKEIITTHAELVQLVKDGYFFNFCVAFALNKGYREAIKEKKHVKFEVGNYDVEFNHDLTCFVLSHQVYFARIIHAYYQEVVFVGDDENENTMKAEDFRIGNIIQDENGKPFTITKLFFNGIIAGSLHIYPDLYPKGLDFNPMIPLTAEWLERLGFKKQKNNLDFTKAATEHCVYFLRWSEAYKEVHAISVCHPIIDSSSTSFAWHIKYVHQLQNLFYSLTGQELTLKP